MGLQGNLKEFSFIQLLNLVNLARKSGGLYVERPGETARVVFREGRLSFAEYGNDGSALLSLLTENKLITPAQNQLFSNRLSGYDEKELGICLVNEGYVSQNQVFSVLENLFSKTVKRLFDWEEGFFRFETGELPPDDRIPVNMELENLIVEGARLHNEAEELKSEIPHLDMALKFTDRPGTDIRNFNLSVEEWRVVSYVNPKNTIAQIASTIKFNETQIRRVIYALLQAGLVELVRPGGLPLSLPGKKITPVNSEAQKSLVKRLITRIRSI